MDPISTQDVSLYGLATDVDRPPSTLQLSPATLKSSIDALLNLLVEQEIPAIVWAKLPRGEVWQTELAHYASTGTKPLGLYRFTTQRREENGNTPNSALILTDEEEVDEWSEESRVSETWSFPHAVIPLPPDGQMRREYFLIVWSAQLQAAFLAHRPRSMLLGQGAHSLEEASERKQLLLAHCSFEPMLVERVLHGLEQLVSPLSPAAGSAGGSFNSVVTQWQQQIAQIEQAPAAPHLLGQLFSRQLQQQEDVWKRGTAYRKQAESSESVRLQSQELQEMLRLKDDFLNNVGQELRTPLTTIKTALTLLSSPNIRPPQRQRYMDLIAKECDRQSSLITSLLDLVQLDRMADQSSLEAVRLADVVPGVVSTYQPLAEEKGIMLAYTIPEDLPPVSCMSQWLKQIVINLLRNGINFTPHGGQVWVRAKRQENFVQLEFRDTGVGISPHEVPKIFDRFYRVRQSTEDASGAGLGLTIVQQLLLHCGGSISVKSRQGEGSIFNVLLPIHPSVWQRE